jgi:hypothetical protein
MRSDRHKIVEEHVSCVSFGPGSPDGERPGLEVASVDEKWVKTAGCLNIDLQISLTLKATKPIRQLFRLCLINNIDF